jgi:hypothetical protein
MLLIATPASTQIFGVGLTARPIMDSFTTNGITDDE